MFLQPLLLLASLPAVYALLVNRTIDDEYGDSVTGVKPVYGPSSDPTGNWIQGLSCVHCTMVPGKVINISQTFDGTWHDSTYHPGNPDHTIDAQFTGTAIYVYFIVPNFVLYTTTLVNLSFTIDGTYYNQYQHIPDNSSSTIMYQVPVFHTTSLVEGTHTIQVRASGSNASILLFDYMEYTVDEPDPNSPPLSSGPPSVRPTSTLPGNTSLTSPSGIASSVRDPPPSSPTSTIAGGVAGGVAVVALLITLYYCTRTRPHGPLMLRRFAASIKGSRILLPISAPEAIVPDGARPGVYPHVPTLPSGDSRLTRLRTSVWRRVSRATTAAAYPIPNQPSHSHDPSPNSKELEAHSEDAVPPSASRSTSTYTGSSRTGESTLRGQVTMLQEELMRLRAEREMHALYVEPPPRYEE